MKKLTILFLISISFSSCFLMDKKFNSETWKTKEDEKIYMLNDIVENKRLLGKTKNEIIDLLDTIDIKQFKYSDKYWMYIIPIPYFVPATKTPVEVMDIEFENEKVKNVTKRKN